MQTLYTLQALRAVAALMVLFSHTQHEVFDERFLDKTSFVTFDPVFWAGGVDIFFVISGFIMYYISSKSFGVPGAFTDFFRRRLIRIAPPYWLFTLAMLAAILLFPSYIAHASLRLSHIAASFLFIPWPNGSGNHFPILILGWTLNFEFFFYCIFAIGLMFSRRVGLSLITTVIFAFGLVGVIGKPGLPVLDFWFSPIIFEFLFGIAIAAMRLKGLMIGRFAAVVLALAAVTIMLFVQREGFTGHWPTRPLWAGIPAAMICASVALGQWSERGRLNRAFAFLGDISYALYLSHPFSIGAVTVLFKVSGWSNPWAFKIIALIVSVVGSIFVHMLIEKPMLRFLRERAEPARMAPQLRAEVSLATRLDSR